MENSGETRRIVSTVMEEYDVIEEPMAEGHTSEDIEDGGLAVTDHPKDQAADVKGDNSGSGSGTSDSSQRSADSQGKPLGSTRGSQRLSEGRDEDTTHFELLCPRVNCPEKIVICLDFSSEMDKPMFRTRAGDKFAPLKLVKRALGFYIHSKHSMDKRHEFALMLLQDSAIWVRDFTDDPREVVNLLEDLQDTAACETCDLSSLFQSIYDRTPMPSVDGDPMVLPPPYVVRVLIIYGRSHCPISIPNKEAQRALFSSPYFFVDAFYVHETPSEDNMCEEIFDSLCDLDHKGFSYIFEASRNPTKIYDFMAQLLAHPLQRPGQKETSYKLKPRPTGE